MTEITEAMIEAGELARRNWGIRDGKRPLPEVIYLAMEAARIPATAPDVLAELVALHDGFMTANDGFMGNQGDAFNRIAKRFEVWDRARSALSAWNTRATASFLEEVENKVGSSIMTDK